MSMDYPDGVKIEKDLRDSNDNLQALLFGVDIKVEKAAETSDDKDWCVQNFAADYLLEPLFFTEFKDPQSIQCSLCFRYFLDRYDILKHNLTHLQVTIVNPRIFQCDICKAYFDNIKSIECHMQIHNNSITNKLSYKPKAYKSNEKGSDFTLTTYNSKQSYIPKSNYNNRAILKDGLTNSLLYKPKTAIRELHQPHRCNICQKMYKYKAWHGHMHDVHGVGKYSCDICQMVFKCERYLNRHIRNKHIGVQKPKGSMKMDVKCDQCDAVLQNLNALTTHRRNVHSDSKHVCGICNSTLKCKSYLLAHMRRVHSNDGKKHECECGKNFRSHRYLMVHKRNAHLKKKNNKGKVKTEVKVE